MIMLMVQYSQVQDFSVKSAVDDRMLEMFCPCTRRKEMLRVDISINVVTLSASKKSTITKMIFMVV